MAEAMPPARAGTRHAFYPVGTIPQGDAVWVFTSDIDGVPSKGDGRIAINHFRAHPDLATGPNGQAYGIATRNVRLQPLPIADIEWQVKGFIAYARARPAMHFFVTRIGNGLAGLSDQRIAPLFASAPQNCVFSEAWRPFLEAVATKEGR